MSADVVRSASPVEQATAKSFSERLAELTARIEFRRADTEEDREAIFRLRYRAYLREGAIGPNSAERFADRDDEADNAFVLGLYIDGELATSLRLHVASKKATPDCPSLHVFPDILQPLLDAGNVLIDATRFVADERLSRLHRGLPYATLRLCMVAAEYFHADHLLAPVRPEHQAFYRRAFNHRLVCEPRPYPQLAKPICLMTVHFPSAAEGLYRKYPFFRSTVSERRKLFDRPRIQPAAANVEPADLPPAPQTRGTIRPFVESGLMRATG